MVLAQGYIAPTDHFTASATILDVGQLHQKLQQMHGNFLFNPYNSAITRRILTKNVPLER